MSTPTPPAKPDATAQRQLYHASSLVVPPRPDEFGFSLREDEFKILCEGELSEARAGRDLSIGCFIASLAGLVGAFATTDWAIIWQEGHRGAFLFFAVLALLVTVSAQGIYIYQRRLNKTRSDSTYSRLRKRIDDFFKNQANTNIE